MYLGIQDGTTSKSYILTDTYAKPYIQVSNSVLPLTTSTKTGFQLNAQDAQGNIYRAMEYSSVSASGSYYTTSADPGQMSSTTALTRASTSATSYGTRASTSNTIYLTNVQTTNTVYYTNIQTTNTIYYTAAQTTNTIYYTAAQTTNTVYGTQTVYGDPVMMFSHEVRYVGYSNEGGTQTYYEVPYVPNKNLGTFSTSAEWPDQGWCNITVNHVAATWFTTHNSAEVPTGVPSHHETTASNVPVFAGAQYIYSTGYANYTLYTGSSNSGGPNWSTGLALTMSATVPTITQTTGTTYLTQAITTNTAYQTRSITTNTVYQTAVFTTATVYQTKVFTTNTIYETRVSTSATSYLTRVSTSAYSGVSSSSFSTEEWQ